MPRCSRTSLGAGIDSAVLVCALLLATRPDIGPIIARYRSYISDWWKTGDS